MTVSNSAGTTRSTDKLLNQTEEERASSRASGSCLACDVRSRGGKGCWGDGVGGVAGGGQQVWHRCACACWREELQAGFGGQAGKRGSALCPPAQTAFRRMSFFPSHSQPFDPLGHESSHLYWPFLQVEEFGETGREAEGWPASTACMNSVAS